jgi:AcrR family transcriptional regulator
VGRWEPDAAGRLRTAALELFATVGYEETTVAQIADHAGVTARTFFRYFADKPEVLFAGSENLEHAMVAALRAAPADASPRAALDAALAAGVSLLSERADFARRRHAVITANPALVERETMKMARMADALGAGLRERGVTEPDAGMIAHAGVAAFRLAFATWVEKPKTSFRQAIAKNLQALAALAD